MNKIITSAEEFKTALKRFKSKLRDSVSGTGLHYYVGNSEVIIEYHIPGLKEVIEKDSSYQIPLGATSDDINYTFNE